MAQMNQDGKLVQMVRMLLFYRKSRPAELNFAQAVSQIMALILQDGCSNFGKFVEKTIKVNQRASNFKLPIFYNQVKNQNRFSAQNLVKAYMLNFSFAQLGRDLFSKALADFYSPEAFCLNHFALIQELSQLCAEDDFSGVTYDQEAVNLREMRENLKETDSSFREYLEFQATIAETGRLHESGTEQATNEGRDTTATEQQQQSDSKLGFSDILGAAGVFKNIGKLFASATIAQHDESKQNIQEAKVLTENLLELEAATVMQARPDLQEREEDQVSKDTFAQNSEPSASSCNAPADKAGAEDYNLPDQEKDLAAPESREQRNGNLAESQDRNCVDEQVESEIAAKCELNTAEVDKGLKPNDITSQNALLPVPAGKDSLQHVQAEFSEQGQNQARSVHGADMKTHVSEYEDYSAHRDSATTSKTQESQLADSRSGDLEDFQETQEAFQLIKREHPPEVGSCDIANNEHTETRLLSRDQEKTPYSGEDERHSAPIAWERTHNLLQPSTEQEHGLDGRVLGDSAAEQNVSADLLISSQNECEPDSSIKQSQDWLQAQKSKLVDIFDMVFQHISAKEGQAVQEQQQQRAGMSVKDVIDVYYAYKKRFGFTQTTATMAFTILVRILAASENLRQFIDETCRFQNDNKNFKLKLFCGKDYQLMQGSLTIAQHIVRGYMVNYMIQLLFADIYSKAVEIFYPAESLLVKEPLIMQQFCADLANIDFNQFEFSYEKTIVSHAQAELQSNCEEKLVVQQLDIEGGVAAQNQPQLELQLEENDFLSHIQLLDQTEAQEDRGQGQCQSQESDEHTLQLTELSRDQSSSDALAHDSGKLASQFEFRAHRMLDNVASASETREVNLQSSSEQSSSELTLTEQCFESQPFETAVRTPEEFRHPVSYDNYQKFNNTELFVPEIGYLENYFTTAQSGHIVQAEKAACGRKMRIQAVKSKPLQSFTLLTQGPLQFQRHCTIKPTNILFDYPQLEARACSQCATALQQDGFFCFNCGCFFCAKHECLRTVLPQYCILGSFTLKTVCLSCYSAVQRQLLTILVPEDEMVVQVRHSVQYSECRRLRTVLVALERLCWKDQQRPTGSAYGSDLDYYREADLEVCSFPDDEHFTIALEVHSMQWTFSDIAGFFDGSVKDRLAIEIRKATQYLGGRRCACGMEIQRSSIAVCPSCRTLRCQTCSLECCAQKQ